MTKLSATLVSFASWNYLRYTLLTRTTATAILAVVGGLWTFVEVAGFFSKRAGEWMGSHGDYFAWTAVILVLLLRRPVIAITHRLSGRDVHITIALGDVLSLQGACVISTNTTFDTDMTVGASVPIISESSLQGQFTKRYYDSSATHLDTDIDAALGNVESEVLSGDRRGKRMRYPLGTVALVRPKGKISYLLAATNMNQSGNCDPATLEQVLTSISCLWDFIQGHGERAPIVIGLIGTGYGRMKEPREVVARETVKSFIAACSSSVFSDHLTLVIHPSDYRKHNLNLYELGDYLRHVCRYASWEGASNAGAGTPVSGTSVLQADLPSREGAT